MALLVGSLCVVHQWNAEILSKLCPDHFWPGRTNFGDRKWSGRTSFCIQNWSGGTGFAWTNFSVTDLRMFSRLASSQMPNFHCIANRIFVEKCFIVAFISDTCSSQMDELINLIFGSCRGLDYSTL